MEDRRNVGENSCNSGDGTDLTGLVLDVYDDDGTFKKNKKHNIKISNEKIRHLIF